jgi:low affinity Fe/Cu permease
MSTKIDELIRASAARNCFAGIEHLAHEEIDETRKQVQPPAANMSETKVS